MPGWGSLMPISLVQQGTLSEFLFIILSVLGSKGMLEASRPATDDDRRDADVHRRGDFWLDLAFQIKSAMQVGHPWAADRLHIRFTVQKDRLVSHPLFFYFFAFLDPRIMRFADPVFIVPSVEVHEHAIPHLHGDVWHFDFHASLGPDAHDRWFPYRVSTLEVGKRILAIIADLEKNKSLILPPPLAGAISPPPFAGGGREGVLLVRRRDAAA
jgi:hypothetical protein